MLEKSLIKNFFFFFYYLTLDVWSNLFKLIYAFKLKINLHFA